MDVIELISESQGDLNDFELSVKVGIAPGQLSRLKNGHIRLGYVTKQRLLKWATDKRDPLLIGGLICNGTPEPITDREALIAVGKVYLEVLDKIPPAGQINGEFLTPPAWE